MKKILIFIMLAVFLTSCYDEFRHDYAYTTVAFSTVTGGLSTSGELGRTVVKGEGLKLQIGVYLAGVLENKEERSVNFTIDPTLLDGTSYELMPADYYTLSNTNTFTIPKGEFVGKLTITLDSVKFLNDPKAISFTYAIPFRLTGTSADSILSTQCTKILVIKYIYRQEGFYDHTGSFTTYDENGVPLNSEDFTSVIQSVSLLKDSIETDGIMGFTGDGYYMHVKVNTDNSLSWIKLPNPPPVPKNLGPKATVTTDYCSGWENLASINDGFEPASSTDHTHGIFGNWYSSNDWGWVQYDFPRIYKFYSSEVYFFTDNGGLLMPDSINVEYWNTTDLEWQPVPNGVGFGKDPDKFNVTTFDEIKTDKIRINFIGYVESVGIIEWKVMGIGDPITLEQAPMATVTPNGANTWDPATSTLTFNYKVTYEDKTYYSIVSSKAVWRNRIRDGVNEWRR